MLIRLSHVVLCPYPCCYRIPFAVCCHDSAVAIPGEDASRAFGKAIHLETIWIGREKLGCLRKDAKGKTDNRIEYKWISFDSSTAFLRLNYACHDEYDIEIDWRTPIQSWRCLHLLFVSPMNCRIPLIPDACFDIRRSSGFGVLPWENPGACAVGMCYTSSLCMYTRRQITPLWRTFTVQYTHTHTHTHTHAHIWACLFLMRAVFSKGRKFDLRESYPRIIPRIIPPKSANHTPKKSGLWMFFWDRLGLHWPH